MPQESSNIRERNRLGLQEPGEYMVIFHNDDFTPMDFVTLVLTQIFFKSQAEAHRLMMKVHNEGRAVVGTYSYDIAMTKTADTTNIARREGFPLRVTVEKK